MVEVTSTRKRIHQCMLGAPTMKPTEIWGTTHIDDLPAECLHSNRSWCVPWSGETYVAPHPRLRGTPWAIPEEQWSPVMKRWSMPRGQVTSKSAVLYSPLMNRELAFRPRMKAGLQRIRDTKYERKGYWANILLRVSIRVDAASAASTHANDTGTNFKGVQLGS